jgi:hypothetical protein
MLTVNWLQRNAQQMEVNVLVLVCVLKQIQQEDVLLDMMIQLFVNHIHLVLMHFT